MLNEPISKNLNKWHYRGRAFSLCCLNSELLLREVIWHYQFLQLGFPTARFCPWKWSGCDRHCIFGNLMSEIMIIYLNIVENTTTVSMPPSEQRYHYLHEISCAYLQKFITLGPVHGWNFLLGGWQPTGPSPEYLAIPPNSFCAVLTWFHVISDLGSD